MQATATKRKNRSRNIPTKDTGVVHETIQDARGFNEPLARIGDLPSGILIKLYNLLNGRPEHSRYGLERLTILIHESAEYTDARRILFRPAYQKRHGLNQQAIYRNSLGATLNLYRHKLLDDTTVQFVNSTRIMAYGDDPTIEPTIHDQELAIIAASIEIEARKHKGFITHLDILKNAHPPAQQSDDPLSVPITKIEAKLPGMIAPAVVKDTHFKTDFLFGLPVADGAKFYWLEHDRSTEDMEPRKSLVRVSWVKKVLMMNAISMGDVPLYDSYFNIPNLRLFATFRSYPRMQNFFEIVRRYGRRPNQFVAAIIPPMDFFGAPALRPELYNQPVWYRHDGSKFALREEVV